MYLKITGIVLIMMSASLMGYLFSKDYIERINRLEQIQKMLILLKGEISYSNNSVQEALENISEMIEGKVGEFVTKVQESFKKSEIPLSVAWSLGVDNIFDKKSSLKSEDKNSLKDFQTVKFSDIRINNGPNNTDKVRRPHLPINRVPARILGDLHNKDRVFRNMK